VNQLVGGGAPGAASPVLRNHGIHGLLGKAAASAARTNTFLGERYRRLVPPPGQAQGPNSHCADHPGNHLAPAHQPHRRFRELGAGYYASRTDKDKKTRGHVRQLEALGYTVTLAPAA
jgi:transposase